MEVGAAFTAVGAVSTEEAVVFTEEAGASEEEGPGRILHPLLATEVLALQPLILNVLGVDMLLGQVTAFPGPAAISRVAISGLGIPIRHHLL